MALQNSHISLVLIGILLFSMFGGAARAENTHSIDLNGTTQYLSTGDTAALSVTGNLTIEMWAKFDSINTGLGILAAKYGGGTDQRAYWVAYRDSSGTKMFESRVSSDGTGANTSVGTLNYTLSTGTWYHLAFVYTAASGTFDVYVATSTSSTHTYAGQMSGHKTSIFNSTSDFMLGSSSGDAPSVFFDGKMDDVRVWNVARSNTQIDDDFQTELNGNEAGLVAYWKLNNGVTDSTSGGHTLTNNNSALFSTDVYAAGPAIDLANRKSTNESVANSTVLQDDNDLKLVLAANKTYIVDGVIFASSTSANPDIVIAFTGQTGSNIRVGYTNDVNEMVLESGDESNRISLPADTPTSIHIKGTVTTSSTAGDFKLKWAQATSASASTTVMAGSYLRAEEI